MSRPGKLDQRITFQRKTLVPDGGGGSTGEWGNVPKTPTVWASVDTSSGSETFQEQRTTAMALAEFVVRNRKDLDETMRIVWGGESYNIRQIARMGAREMYLTIKAERGAAT